MNDKNGLPQQKSNYPPANASISFSAKLKNLPSRTPPNASKLGMSTSALILKLYSARGNLSEHWLGCEINPEYVQIAEKRLANKEGMF
jgi:hypothetical protein